MGILVCGLNGSGKTAFGKALAEKLNCRFIDREELYFTDDDYSKSRTDEEAQAIPRN